MIKTLVIKNYALIESLSMEPSGRLNVITGETGAGKSIMLGAIGLLLGNRADTKALFAESSKCVIEATFELSNDFLPFFEKQELEFDQECIIRREISPTGKSRGFINDTPVTLDVMRRLGADLMDIHSQYESLQLGKNQYQLEILDLFAQNSRLKSTFQEAYKSFKTIEKKLADLKAMATTHLSELDYNQFLFDELEQAGLEGVNQKELENELEALENAEEIKLGLSGLTQLLEESEVNTIDQLKTALQILVPIKGFHSPLEELYGRLNSSALEIQDIAREVLRENDGLEISEERITELRARVDLLNRLQQKHQVSSVEGLLSIQQSLQEKLNSVLNLDSEIEQTTSELNDLKKKMLTAGEKLSKSRMTAKDVFAKEIEQLIHQLGIENGQVYFELTQTDPYPYGLESVELLFSANKGVKPREIKHVASGGEFSRLIFAIKYLLAGKTRLPTLIFDEIDTGVSGEIALRMIQMMKKMAFNHQVIAISHLPQFAAGGDAHYFVYKDHSASKSMSRIRLLEENERVDEIAKMISGSQSSESARVSAQELLSNISLN